MPLPGKALPDVRERIGVYTFDEEGAGDIVVGLRGEERGVWYERYGEKMGHAQVRRALKCKGMSDGDLDDWAVDLDSSHCSDKLAPKCFIARLPVSISSTFSQCPWD